MNIRFTKYLGGLFLLLTLFNNSVAGEAKASTFQMVTFLKQQIEISVEIASDEAQRELGLMYRTQLGEKQGMLFVYPDQAIRQVWMKNTLLSLDVLFLSDDGHIISILTKLEPCVNDPCSIYDSQKAAMYMLELNAGFVDNNQIKTGQQLRLPSVKNAE